MQNVSFDNLYEVSKCILNCKNKKNLTLFSTQES